MVCESREYQSHIGIVNIYRNFISIVKGKYISRYNLGKEDGFVKSHSTRSR